MRRLAYPVLIAAALWLAMLILGGPDTPLDEQLLDAARCGVLVQPALLFTALGSGPALILITLVAACYLALRREPRSALLLIGLTLAGRLLVEVQKMGFDRLRPDPAGHLVAVHNMAFPSGHAANSMIVGLGIALIVFPRAGLRSWAVGAALIFSLLVGGSRLVLGVHWPSDVLGGWAFGTVWTLALVHLAEAKGWLRNVSPAPSLIGRSVRDSDKPEDGDLPRFNDSN